MKKALNNDILLLYDMQNGSKRAFDSIFRKYYPILCYYARHSLTQEDAEEVVQDILLWIWENKHELTIDYSLKQYLFRMLHHRCINKILQNEAKLKADTAFYQKTMEALHDTDVAQVNELSRHIKEAINALPVPYREAFVMHRFQQLSHKEIAAKLNVSHQTVNYRIGQAVKLLRTQLKDYLPFLILFYYHHLK